MKTKPPVKPVKQRSSKRVSQSNPFGLPKRGDPPIRNPFAALRASRVPVLIAPSLAEHFQQEGVKKGYLLDDYIAHLLVRMMPVRKARRLRDVVIFSHRVLRVKKRSR